MNSARTSRSPRHGALPKRTRTDDDECGGVTRTQRARLHGLLPLGTLLQRSSNAPAAPRLTTTRLTGVLWSRVTWVGSATRPVPRPYKALPSGG